MNKLPINFSLPHYVSVVIQTWYKGNNTNSSYHYHYHVQCSDLKFVYQYY